MGQVALAGMVLTICYDFADPYLRANCAGTGQDGEFLIGKELAYEDLGDGRIEDLNTGLQWEKKIVPEPPLPTRETSSPKCGWAE